MGKFRIEIDKNVCQGFGSCGELCPKFFKVSDADGKSTIKGAQKVIMENEVVAETLMLDELDCTREAAEACPFNAIHVINLQTGEKYV